MAINQISSIISCIINVSDIFLMYQDGYMYIFAVDSLLPQNKNCKCTMLCIWKFNKSLR